MTTSATSNASTATVAVEVVAWITKFIGGDGSGRRVLHEPYADGATVRSILQTVASRYPELEAALGHGQQLGEHVEVLVKSEEGPREWARRVESMKIHMKTSQ